MFFLYEAHLTWKSFNLLLVILSLSLKQFVSARALMFLSVLSHGMDSHAWLARGRVIRIVFSYMQMNKISRKKSDSLSWAVFTTYQSASLLRQGGIKSHANWPIRYQRFRDKLHVNSLTARCDRIKKPPRSHQDNTAYLIRFFAYMTETQIF